MALYEIFIFCLVRCTGTLPPLSIKRPIPPLSATKALPPAFGNARRVFPLSLRKSQGLSTKAPSLVNGNTRQKLCSLPAKNQASISSTSEVLSINAKETSAQPSVARQKPTLIPNRKRKSSLPSHADGSVATLASPSALSHSPKRKVCPYCAMILSDRSNFLRHIKRQHPGREVPVTEGTCLCMLCNVKALSIKHLIQHYNDAHGKNMKISKIAFNCKEEFENFKKEAEKQSMADFVKVRGGKKSISCVKESFYCCRSGEAKLVSESDRKRAKRSQGSRKISGKCTCFITVKYCCETKKVVAEFCLDHMGHEKARDMENGETAHRMRMRDIRNRHRSAVSKHFTVEHKKEDEWVVHSPDETCAKQYFVKKAAHDSCKCKQICTACGVCSLMFVCTCFDHVAQGLPCKHIHAVQMSLSTGPTMEALPSSCDQGGQGDSETDFLKQHNSTDNAQYCNSFQDLRTAILHKINDLIDVVNSAIDDHTLNSIMNTVTSTITAAKTPELTNKNKSAFEVAKVDPKTLCQTRKRHFSTKGDSRRKQSKLSESNPSEEV